MVTEFRLITDEFHDDLQQIGSLVNSFDSSSSGSPKLRVAAVNSATLLLAATFEEYIRQMARCFARHVVSGAATVEKVPPKLLTTAWKRTFEDIARAKFEEHVGSAISRPAIHTARQKIEDLLDFANGDTSKDIFGQVVQNDVNMRPGEINRLFKMSGMSNVCESICGRSEMQSHFSETDRGRTHGRLLAALEAFFERRNSVAHALNPKSSDSPTIVNGEIDFFRALSLAL